MLTLYTPGDGWLHRMPAGRKALLLMAIMLGVLLLPPRWWAVAVIAGVSVGAYLVADLPGRARGLHEIGRQVWSLRWVLLITLAGARGAARAHNPHHRSARRLRAGAEPPATGRRRR